MLHFWNILCSERHVPEIFSCFKRHVSKTTSHFWNEVTFLKHFMFWMSHFWNILSFKLHFSETLFEHLVLFMLCSVTNVTFPKHFIFWTSRLGNVLYTSHFWDISSSERHVSIEFHIWNVIFSKYIKLRTLRFWNNAHVWKSWFWTHVFINFIFWMSYFWNISCFKCHFSKTLLHKWKSSRKSGRVYSVGKILMQVTGGELLLV